MCIDLSIIIVNWNTKNLLDICISSVVENLRDLDYEVLVVDNASIDGSAQMVRNKFPAFSLIENQENKGFAKANNQAIMLSKGKYILLLNSDAYLTANAIQTMIQVLEKNPSIGIAGARLEHPDGRAQQSHAPLPSLWSETACLFGLDKLVVQKNVSQEFVETGMVNGACLLIRKTLLDQIGLLDESFYMFSEEVDLCNRCHNAGAKVVHIPSALVIHLEAGSSGQTVQRTIRLYNSKQKYFRKHYGPKVELNLKRMMVISSIFKSYAYHIIRVVSFGFIRKDEFWRAVSDELLATMR